jgi:hypothetical protein
MVGFETATLGAALGSVLAGALAAWLGAELVSLLGVALLPPPVEQALTSAMIDAPRASVRRIRMWVPPCSAVLGLPTVGGIYQRIVTDPCQQSRRGLSRTGVRRVPPA